jgi:hypothetical protein
MANLPDHLRQAQHNETFAEQLYQDGHLQHWDWLITVCFYAAVHYAEALFFACSAFTHTESVPNGKDKHAFREKKVLDILGHDCYRSYRKLRLSSHDVRYLGQSKQRPGQIAIHYYSLADARKMYSSHLPKVREAVLAKLKQ